MKSLIQFSVNKAITVFMVVLAVGVFGVVSFTRLTTDLFPDVNIPFAVVVTTVPGATPDEVEARVSVPLETNFQTATNIQEVTSMSQENVSMILLEFSQGTDMSQITVELRENLTAMIDFLPDEASTPIIFTLNPNMLPIMTFSVTYEGKDLEALTDWVSDELRPQIERVPGVASVSISGGFESEIRLFLDQDAMDMINAQFAMIPNNEFELDRDYIEGILTAQNFAFPAGFVRISGIDYLVRVGDSIESLEELEQLTLFSSMGQTITLKDVATIEFVESNQQRYSKVNGEDALTISIQKGSDFATTDVTDAVNRVLNRMLEDEDVTIVMLLDQGEYINQSTSSVTNNLLIGGLLAIAILFLFLRNLPATFVVGVAIPISLLFAVVLIYLSGITLNLVSLGGLALGIGMLVDNGIVVIENIFRLKKEGASKKEAAIYGTHQVAGAITASTLTTIGVFLPIMFIEDFIREIFYQLALTVAFSLIASLFIALTLVPALSAKVLSGKSIRKSAKKESKFKVIQEGYGKVLTLILRGKSIVMIAVLVLFIVSIGLATSRGFEFFPATDEGALNISIEMDPDAPLDFAAFTEELDRLYEDLRDYPDIQSIGISLGGGMFMLGAPTGDSANISVVLRDSRSITTLEMQDEITRLLENEYPQFSFEISGTQGDVGALVGSGVQVRVKGLELDQLRNEAGNIATLLEDIDGLRDIDPGFGREAREVKITVDKDLAMQSFLTVGQVLGQVNEFLSGPSSIGQVRLNARTYAMYIYETGDESRRSVDDIEAIRNLEIVSPTGSAVLLSEIAEVDIQPGFSRITRVDGSRAITVSAEFATGVNVTEVSQEIERRLADYPLPDGYEYEILGENEEVMAAIQTLLLAGILAILIVYMIMASQFQSLVYPFIIMFTIPLAFTGGFLALYLFNFPVSVVAVIGLIILSGVVVNNGIVLVDYINQLREKGWVLKEALIEAGKVRIRPIFMTALTTILALSGLALGFGEGAELMQPLALTAIGGLIYATILTIFVVPIMYYGITLYGRYIFGGLLVLGVLFAGYLMMAEAGYYLIASIIISILITLGLFLVPKTRQEKPIKARENEKQQPKDELDRFIEEVIKS